MFSQSHPRHIAHPPAAGALCRRRQLLIKSAVIAVLGGCSASASPAAINSVYQCSDGRIFSVARDDSRAAVYYEDERYSLSRRPSSIGLKYASPEATLIVDGAFAAFVTETIVDLENCNESSEKRADRTTDTQPQLW